MTIVVSEDQIKTVIEGEEINWDRYHLEEKTLLSTKEVTIILDFKNEEITGDCIAYGGWFELSVDECLSYAREITNPIRNFDYIVNKYIRT